MVLVYYNNCYISKYDMHVLSEMTLKYMKSSIKIYLSPT